MTTQDPLGSAHTATGSAFSGWPEAAFDFFARLETDNTKPFWEANRHVYDTAVRAPMEAFGALVADDYGPLHIFRPYRDVRFSKDKSPYKTHCGAVTEGRDGELYYVHVSAEGLLAASGYHQMARDQLERFFAAVDDDESGPELVALVDGLSRAYDIGGSALKTAPRGYARDHPRVALLRHKGLTVTRTFPLEDWHSTPAAATRTPGGGPPPGPLNAWLNRHVGPSTLPPPERR